MKRLMVMLLICATIFVGCDTSKGKSVSKDDGSSSESSSQSESSGVVQPEAPTGKKFSGLSDVLYMTVPEDLYASEQAEGELMLAPDWGYVIISDMASEEVVFKAEEIEKFVEDAENIALADNENAEFSSSEKEEKTIDGKTLYGARYEYLDKDNEKVYAYIATIPHGEDKLIYIVSYMYGEEEYDELDEIIGSFVWL